MSTFSCTAVPESTALAACIRCSKKHHFEIILQILCFFSAIDKKSHAFVGVLKEIFQNCPSYENASYQFLRQTVQCPCLDMPLFSCAIQSSTFMPKYGGSHHQQLFKWCILDAHVFENLCWHIFIPFGVSRTMKTSKISVYNTMYSQAVTHPSTNMAQCCLTSVIGRELVFST